MQRLKAGLVVGAVALLVSGCGQGGAATSEEAVRSAAVIEQLPPEDRQLALNQWTCPVCGEVLGSSGTPVKKVNGGETRFFDREQCAEEFTKDSKRFDSRLSE